MDVDTLGQEEKTVSDEMRERHADVPWTEMARTQDKWIHAYFRVGVDVV